MEESESEETDVSSEESLNENQPASDESEEKSEEDNETGPIFEFMSYMRYVIKTPWFAKKLKLVGEDDEELIDQYISESVNVIKSFDRLEYLNGELLVLAACFDHIYKTKNKLNETNITEFVTKTDKNTIDVIRYIMMYQNNKTI